MYKGRIGSSLYKNSLWHYTQWRIKFPWLYPTCDIVNQLGAGSNIVILRGFSYVIKTVHIHILKLAPPFWSTASWVAGIDQKTTSLTDKLNLALNLQSSHRAVVFPNSIHRSILAVDNLVRCVQAIRPNESCT